MSLLKSLETAEAGTEITLNALLEEVKFNDQGLVPAIAQDSQTHSVLMLAWMDEQSIRTTLEDGFATYYSRSRKAYWRKGETSGHLQKLRSMRFDCDADTILLTVDQSGPACHTERQHCFYLKVDAEKVIVAPAE
ncbi:MAG: phosphoribosyl-AMP cyclohydrolase [Limisphaerales bacterium]|jgi:phosphoribosyl-AMP cyclohydrolase